MVGITVGRLIRVIIVAVFSHILIGCVSTEALYAEYDAADCKLVATTDISGAVSLHEQNTDTHYPWEPAVYFEVDSSALSLVETRRLDKSLQVLKQFPSLVLGLQGFTDKSGSAGYNKALAEQRVLVVKQYVESKGIAVGRVMLQPIGEVLPQIDDSSAARANNRRVELMLLDDTGRPMPVQYALKKQ